MPPAAGGEPGCCGPPLLRRRQTTMAHATAPATPAPISAQPHAGRPDSSLSEALWAAFAAAAPAAAAAGALLVEVVGAVLDAVVVSVLMTVLVCVWAGAVVVLGGAVVVLVCVTVFVGDGLELDEDVDGVEFVAADAFSVSDGVLDVCDALVGAVAPCVPVLAEVLCEAAAWLRLLATVDAAPEPHAASPITTQLTTAPHASRRSPRACPAEVSVLGLSGTRRAARAAIVPPRGLLIACLVPCELTQDSLAVWGTPAARASYRWHERACFVGSALRLQRALLVARGARAITRSTSTDSSLAVSG
ncbi:MAG TPA: hypothetical protein VGX51_05105 [Solirubrobacteraceae bacterium]|nr:hypothetical protein [Solirubrobacteraceae bacterium]